MRAGVNTPNTPYHRLEWVARPHRCAFPRVADGDCSKPVSTPNFKRMSLLSRLREKGIEVSSVVSFYKEVNEETTNAVEIGAEASSLLVGEGEGVYAFLRFPNGSSITVSKAEQLRTALGDAGFVANEDGEYTIRQFLTVASPVRVVDLEKIEEPTKAEAEAMGKALGISPKEVLSSWKAKSDKVTRLEWVPVTPEDED